MSTIMRDVQNHIERLEGLIEALAHLNRSDECPECYAHMEPSQRRCPACGTLSSRASIEHLRRLLDELIDTARSLRI